MAGSTPFTSFDEGFDSNFTDVDPDAFNMFYPPVPEPIDYPRCSDPSDEISSSSNAYLSFRECNSQFELSPIRLPENWDAELPRYEEQSKPIVEEFSNDSAEQTLDNSIRWNSERNFLPSPSGYCSVPNPYAQQENESISTPISFVINDSQTPTLRFSEMPQVSVPATTTSVGNALYSQQSLNIGFQASSGEFSDGIHCPSPSPSNNPSPVQSGYTYTRYRFGPKPRVQVARANTFGEWSRMDENTGDLLAFLRPNHEKELRQTGTGLGSTSTSPTLPPIPVLGDSSKVVVKQKSQSRKQSPSSFLLIPSSSSSSIPVAGDSIVRKRADGPCVVCDAEGAGFHFGAIVCAACSAFFRRTVAEKRKYSCRKEGPDHLNCPIDQRHRCFCRACRLQKCLAKGMDPAAVQPHRDSIGAKRERRQDSPNDEQEKEADLYNQLIDESQRSQTLTHLAEQLLAFSRAPVFSSEQSASGFEIVSNKFSADLMLPKYESNLSRSDTGSTEHVQKVVFPEDLAQRDAPSRESVSSCSSNSGATSIYVPHQNLIEVMVEQYRKLVERRRLIYCPSSIKDILSGTMPTPRAAKYSHGMRRYHIRIEISLFVEFLNSIHPFPKLSLEDKIALIKHLSVSYSVLEKYYWTMRAGGLQKNRIIHADGSYTELTDPGSIEYEISTTAGGERMDRDTFIKLFIGPLREALGELCTPMYHYGMTDVEFCGLVGILLFDPGTPGLDESTTRIVRDARNKICSDWFAYYAHHEIKDGIERVGNSMLLMPALQSTVAKTAENFHLIRVFELFEYDKILDDIFTSGHDYMG